MLNTPVLKANPTDKPVRGGIINNLPHTFCTMGKGAGQYGKKAWERLGWVAQKQYHKAYYEADENGEHGRKHANIILALLKSHLLYLLS